MPSKRPVFLPKLARTLVELREARQWKQAHAADLADRRGLAVGYQALRWLEEGKIKSPEPELLRAVADLYEFPYPALVGLFLAERYGVAVSDVRDLPRQSGDQASGPHREESTDVPASGSLAARIVELEGHLADRDAQLRHVSDAARLLMRRLALPEKDTAARSAQSGRRRRR